ncbi:MAG: ATP-binding cassette domain-containing protein [Candidatus Brocadiia bacterium]|nr:ATP-binding cassette domain-containing protein [Candidatus Brocadiia bacterium]
MARSGVVEVEGLVKVYPGGTRAVDGIEFAVEAGELFGFLGPNGAGKSTTLKILATLLRKTSGRVMVAGHDVERDPKAVRKAVGFAMQDVGLDDLATGRDFLTLQGLLYRLPRAEAKRRAEELLDIVGLTSVAGRRVGAYSGGMRRRIDLAAALVHRPSVLFLDEPTTGLDPQSRLAVWDYLQELSHEGVTVFLTTQMMEEADRLCRRIAIVDAGKIVAEGSPEELKRRVGGDVVRVVLQGGAYAGAGASAAGAALRDRPYVSDLAESDGAISVRVEDGAAVAPDILHVLREAGLPAAEVSISSPSLDDVFLGYTGHTIRAEDATGDESGRLARPWLGLNRR